MIMKMITMINDISNNNYDNDNDNNGDNNDNSTKTNAWGTSATLTVVIFA